MRKTLMCPKCGYVDCPYDDDHDFDLCYYCNTKKIQIDFSGEEVYDTPTTEFNLLEQKLNRKFLFQLPTFDEEVYEARLKEENEAEERCNQRAIERANGPHCPICNSANIHKISGFNKAASIGLFGVFSIGHVSKTFKCDHCGAKF